MLKKASAVAAQAIGRVLPLAALRLRKAPMLIGRVAMFMVGGGIITHGIAPLHHAIEHAGAAVGSMNGVGFVLDALTTTLLDMFAGVVAGALTLFGAKADGALTRALRANSMTLD